MYEEIFEEFQLTVVELPIEFVDDLPVYRGHLKELTFLSVEASSRKNSTNSFYRLICCIEKRIKQLLKRKK